MWAQALADISEEQLETALTTCAKRTDPWPPSLPEFHALCLGIPTWRALRLELTREDIEHHSPFARLVWQFVDAWRYRNADFNEAERLLRDAYDKAVQARLDGKPLPAHVPALPVPEPTPFKPAAAEVVKRHLDEIRSMLHVQETCPHE